MLKRLNPDRIFLAIPIFTPHQKMLDFESYRATLETFQGLRGYLNAWSQNEQELLETAQSNSVGSAMERLEQGMDLSALFRQEQNELYLTVHPDCKLYVGNSGAETDCLGDLRTLDAKETAGIIKTLPGNRDYGAYYNFGNLPSLDQVRGALKSLDQSLVHGDFESILYRAFAQLRIPTKILNLAI